MVLGGVNCNNFQKIPKVFPQNAVKENVNIITLRNGRGKENEY